MSDRVTTQAIKKALEARFCAPEWAAFFEVAQGTGGNAGRSADCVAMNLYPSRGLRVHGVEIKASRSDWLRELKDPAKAEPIMRFCDHWWIAAKKGIVLPGELPPTWGLMELHGTTMRQKVAAPKLEAKPMDRAFTAAMFRRACERASRELREACDEKLEAERGRIREQIDRAVNDRSRGHEELKRSVAAFEEASGIEIKAYGGGKELGQAVKLLQDMGVIKAWGGVRNIANSARAFADKVDELLPAADEEEE